MTKATNNQAKHMRQTNSGAARKGRGRMVAIALAGVLALGGAGAVCVAGLGKSPGQAPAATQQQATKDAATKTATKPETKQATTKTAAKPAVKQATQQSSRPAVKQATQQARPAQQQQQQTSRPQPQPAKPAQQQQQTSKPAPQPQPAPQQQQAQPQAQPQAEQGSGMEVKVSREGAIAIARDYTGAGGQAKGEAYNVTCRGPITGGGTVYYVVELDLGEVHYSVTVDAVEGNVISADQVHAGTRTLLDSKTGEPQEGTEQPVDA